MYSNVFTYSELNVTFTDEFHTRTLKYSENLTDFQQFSTNRPIRTLKTSHPSIASIIMLQLLYNNINIQTILSYMYFFVPESSRSF